MQVCEVGQGLSNNKRQYSTTTSS